MDRNHAALFRVCRFWSGLFFAVVVSLVLRAGVGGGFGSELLLLESSLNRHPSLTPQSSILSFGLFGFSAVWCGLFVGPVQNAAGEDRTPDLRIMRPTRCQLRYCRLGAVRFCMTCRVHAHMPCHEGVSGWGIQTPEDKSPKPQSPKPKDECQKPNTRKPEAKSPTPKAQSPKAQSPK